MRLGYVDGEDADRLRHVLAVEGISLEELTRRLVKTALRVKDEEDNIDLDYEKLASAVVKVQNEISPRYTKEQWLEHLEFDDCPRCTARVRQILGVDAPEEKIRALCPSCGDHELKPVKGKTGWLGPEINALKCDRTGKCYYDGVDVEDLTGEEMALAAAGKPLNRKSKKNSEEGGKFFTGAFFGNDDEEDEDY
jgi:hypothetical protein